VIRRLQGLYRDELSLLEEEDEESLPSLEELLLMTLPRLPLSEDDELERLLERLLLPLPSELPNALDSELKELLLDKLDKLDKEPDDDDDDRLLSELLPLPLLPELWLLLLPDCDK